MKVYPYTWKNESLMTQGMYKGGSFNFSFAIGNEYPHQPPKVRCTQRVKIHCRQGSDILDIPSQYRYSGEYLSQRPSRRLETSSQPQRRHLRITSTHPMRVRF